MNAFCDGLKYAERHGNEAIKQNLRSTDDMGMTLLIEGWRDAPVTPESVGRELFGDESLLVGREETYMRDFCRGVLCY